MASSAPPPEEPTATPDVAPIAEPPPVPASDTLEALPEGFWGPPVGPAPQREPTPTAAAPAGPAAAAPAEPTSDHAEPHPDTASAPASGSGTIATLQRLFPGRVLRVEADEPPLERGAAVEEDAAGTTEAADRENPASGLESPGSRDT